jgi:hypothetical protein
MIALQLIEYSPVKGRGQRLLLNREILFGGRAHLFAMTRVSIPAAVIIPHPVWLERVGSGVIHF